MKIEMTVKERGESRAATWFQLEKVNDYTCPDGRMTVVVKAGEPVPDWKVGSTVSVTVEAA